MCDVRAFVARLTTVNEVSLPALAKLESDRPHLSDVFVEEAFYHFVHSEPSRTAWRYRFVDVTKGVLPYLGAWPSRAVHALENLSGESPLECALSLTPFDAVSALVKKLASLGITLMRCRPGSAPDGIDLCVSGACGRAGDLSTVALQVGVRTSTMNALSVVEMIATPAAQFVVASAVLILIVVGGRYGGCSLHFLQDRFSSQFLSTDTQPI